MIFQYFAGSNTKVNYPLDAEMNEFGYRTMILGLFYLAKLSRG
jgi:hypothetical protein